MHTSGQHKTRSPETSKTKSVPIANGSLEQNEAGTRYYREPSYSSCKEALKSLVTFS